MNKADNNLKKDNIRCSLSDKSVSKRQKEQTSSDIFGSDIKYQDQKNDIHVELAEKITYDKDIEGVESVDLIDIYNREFSKQYNNVEYQGEKYKVRTAPSKDIARADDAEKIKENIFYPSDNNYDGKSKKHDSKIEIIDCPKCGYKNLSNSNSCSFCGCDLTTSLKCPDCNYKISYNDTHCPYCEYDLSYYFLNAKFAINQYEKLVTTLIVALIVLIPLILEMNRTIPSSLVSIAMVLATYVLPVIIFRYIIKRNPISKKRGTGLSVIFTIASSFVFLILLDYIDLDYFIVGAVVPAFFGYVNYLMLTSKNPTNKINK